MAVNVNADRILELLRENAATNIMPYFRNLQESDVEAKGHEEDLVTVADQQSEQFLRDALEKSFPTMVVIGEEQVHADPSALNALKGDKPVWVIDPVDGTYNFRHGTEYFGVILSLIHEGQTLMGWHYYPLSDEVLAVEQGSGTWLGDERMAMKADGVEGSKAMTFLDVVNPPLFEKIKPIVEGLGISLEPAYRCSAYDYRLLVTNEVQCLLSTSSKIWDHGAGQLMVTEAGGVRVHFNGKPYSPLYESAGQMCVVDQRFIDGLSPIFELV